MSIYIPLYLHCYLALLYFTRLGFIYEASLYSKCQKAFINNAPVFVNLVIHYSHKSHVELELSAQDQTFEPPALDLSLIIATTEP